MSDVRKPVNRRRIAGERPSLAPAVPTKAKRSATVAAPVAPKVRTATKTADRVRTPAPTPAPVIEKDDADARRASRRDRMPVVVLALVAVVSVIAGAALLVTGVSDRFGSGGTKIDAAQTQASAAAGSAAETIFSFRYDALDDHLTTSQALMTPAFAKDFEKIAPALTELAPQRKIVVQAAARNSAAMPCGDDCSASKVDVLVFLDQARLVGESTTPTVFANRVKVTMVRSDGNWRVSDIRAL